MTTSLDVRGSFLAVLGSFLRPTQFHQDPHFNLRTYHDAYETAETVTHESALRVGWGGEFLFCPSPFSFIAFLRHGSSKVRFKDKDCRKH
jgi:hypothetical protein